jgi:hypothetical protein
MRQLTDFLLLCQQTWPVPYPELPNHSVGWSQEQQKLIVRILHTDRGTSHTATFYLDSEDELSKGPVLIEEMKQMLARAKHARRQEESKPKLVIDMAPPDTA